MANIELDGVNKKIKVDSGDLTLDVPGDIVLDADGGDVVVADGGTNILKVTNSSSDVVLQPQVDAKDIIFKQYDRTTVATVEDNATFNIPASKLAIGGTAVTSTAAELNILDGVTATATELNLIDGVTATTAELNILDGVTATASELNLLDGGTSVGGSITLADADGFVVNDGGTMKTIPATDVATYAGGGTLVRVGGSNSSSATGTVILDNIFTADYMFYKVYGRMEPSVDNYLPQMRLRTGGSSGSDESGTNYKFTLKTSRKGNNTDDNNDGSASGNAFSIGRYGTDAETENGGYFEMTVCNPYGTGTLSGTGAGDYCHVFSHYTHKGSSDNAVQTMMGGRYDGSLTATGMKFQFTSNNVEEHNIQVYGVKNS